MDNEIQQIIERKIEHLQRQVDSLQEILPLDNREYLADWVLRLAVERLCQIVVECATDINTLFIEQLAHTSPQTSRESFEMVRSRGIISEQVDQRFEITYVGFRNRIVHDYDKIDPTIAYNTARRLIPDATQYASEIRQYLDSLEEAEETSPAGATHCESNPET